MGETRICTRIGLRECIWLLQQNATNIFSMLCEAKNIFGSEICIALDHWLSLIDLLFFWQIMMESFKLKTLPLDALLSGNIYAYINVDE